MPLLLSAIMIWPWGPARAELASARPWTFEGPLASMSARPSSVAATRHLVSVYPFRVLPVSRLIVSVGPGPGPAGTHTQEVVGKHQVRRLKQLLRLGQEVDGVRGLTGDSLVGQAPVVVQRRLQLGGDLGRFQSAVECAKPLAEVAE